MDTLDLLAVGVVSSPLTSTLRVLACSALLPLILPLILNHFLPPCSPLPYQLPAHPHTNMAKASLNMMTRTSAGSYAKDAIFMNAVDTGWINEGACVC